MADQPGAFLCSSPPFRKGAARLNSGGMSVRTRQQMPEERARIYNSIRCDSLRMSGVRLSGQDKSLLGRLLPEGELPIWRRREREKLTNLFADIRRQLVSEGFSAIRELDDILFSILNH